MGTMITDQQLEIELLKQAIRDLRTELDHQLWCKGALEATLEVANMNIELTDKQVAEFQTKVKMLRGIVMANKRN